MVSEENNSARRCHPLTGKAKEDVQHEHNSRETQWKAPEVLLTLPIFQHSEGMDGSHRMRG